MPRAGFFDDHRNTTTTEIVGDLVDTPKTIGTVLRRSQKSLIKRIAKRGLQSRVDRREPQHLWARHPLFIERSGQFDSARGECSRLISTQNGHRPKTLDRIRTTYDHPGLRHSARTMRESHRHDGGQQLRRQAHGQSKCK